MTMLTPQQAADRIGVSLSLIYAVLKAGKLPALRVGCNGKGRWLITQEDFDNWLQSCRVSEMAQEDDGELKYL